VLKNNTNEKKSDATISLHNKKVKKKKKKRGGSLRKRGGGAAETSVSGELAPDGGCSWGGVMGRGRESSRREEVKPGGGGGSI